LSISDGEYAAVMGPSGCGKSTLLNVIAGLIEPSGGEVVLAGERLTGRSEDELATLRRRHIGMVFQFFNLLEGMTALENVVLAALIAGVERPAAERRAQELLAMLGLADRERVLPTGLSGGQRQRLAIARALANTPTLLLADEPTGALDSDGAAEIMELFSGLHRGGQTIVLVTHDAAVAASAQRLLLMRDGRITEAAATAPMHSRAV
jgi:putative ABC transport system ATP-binding protein